MPGEHAQQQGPTRREILAAGGASALSLGTGLGMSGRPKAVTGVVFEDRSGEGLRRPGDRGISDVMVSNGRDVVLSDADGRWQLPVAEGDSVFVIKPPHWSTPMDGALPRFSYLHQPRGTPGEGFRYPVLAPTQPLPQSIDFPLRQQREPAQFEALLLADSQPQNGAELVFLRDDILANTIDCQAAFAINHGDVVFDDLSLYPRYLEMVGATGIPWHHCPGNHDINQEAREDRYSRETWKRVFGPRHYAFQYGGATFILLDNVYYFGHNPGNANSGEYCGLIGDEQLQFVRNVLAHVPDEGLVVLSMHIPLATYQDLGNPTDNTADRSALLALLRDRRYTVSFSGHMHLTEHHYLLSHQGATQPHHHHVLTAASGGWWGGLRDRRGIPFADSADGNTNGYHVLSVDGQRYTTRFVPAPGKAAGTLRAEVVGCRDRKPLPTEQAAIPAVALGHCAIFVNVFDGGPRTKVTCAIGGRHPVQLELERMSATDPFITDLFKRTAAEQKSWVRPVRSSHLWTAPLWPELAPGAHRVSVRVTDEYGRRHSAHMMLEVSGPRAASRET